MVKIWKGFWSLDDAYKNPKAIFVFGDNLLGYGNGGQACIRPAKNSFGIPTKNSPSMSNDAFFSDDEFEKITKIIDEKFNQLNNFESEGYLIYFPENPLGSGLAKLNICAPKIYQYLQNKVNQMLL